MASASDWRAEAVQQGLGRPQIDRMASAFEHEDMERARAL